WLIPKEEGEPKVNEEDVSDFDEQIYDTFKNGIIKLKYLNTTGIEVAADILICRSETELKQQIYEFDNPDTTKVKVISVPYLQTTNEKELQEIQVQIQQTDLEYLLEEITYIGTRLGLYSEPGTPLTGSIQMQAELIIEVQMGDHLLED
ncbi:MAG: hypothetical protein SVM86_00165, partial [Candidatus Cloacimonadota bacterium]|nr:hypothetical protein [Candidatus Cloacimonadota bacterium]